MTDYRRNFEKKRILDLDIRIQPKTKMRKETGHYISGWPRENLQLIPLVHASISKKMIGFSKRCNRRSRSYPALETVLKLATLWMRFMQLRSCQKDLAQTGLTSSRRRRKIMLVRTDGKEVLVLDCHVHMGSSLFMENRAQTRSGEKIFRAWTDVE